MIILVKIEILKWKGAEIYFSFIYLPAVYKFTINAYLNNKKFKFRDLFP